MGGISSCGRGGASNYLSSDAPVFGVALSEARRSENHPEVPKIVVDCIEFVRRHGNIEKQGIYRVSGVKSKIQALKRLIHVDGNYEAIQSSLLNTVTGVLKLYFHELADRLLPCEELTKRIATITDISNEGTRKTLSEYVQSLQPSVHYATLKYLMKHLHAVSELREKNLMNANNLATIWVPGLFSSDVTNSKATDVLFLIGIVEVMIEHYAEIFDDHEIEWISMTPEPEIEPEIESTLIEPEIESTLIEPEIESTLIEPEIESE